MTIIRIANDVPAAAVATLESFLARTALRDPNWNGVEFAVVRDDYTCIDDDSAEAVALLRTIFRIIDGHG